MTSLKHEEQGTLSMDENLEDKSDHFKILISPIQSDLISILRDKLFEKLGDCFYLCNMVIASNNEKTIVQPHNLIELDSIRIFLQTEQVYPNKTIRELIETLLQEFYQNSVDQSSFKSIIPITTIYKLARKNFMNLVQWATFGGDHAPRFSPGITPDSFSMHYKTHCWAERNLDKKFDELDSFVIAKSEKTQKCLRRYLEKYKFTKNYNYSE
jgi:hypothetical protein